MERPDESKGLFCAGGLRFVSLYVPLVQLSFSIGILQRVGHWDLFIFDKHAIKDLAINYVC